LEDETGAQWLMMMLWDEKGTTAGADKKLKGRVFVSGIFYRQDAQG
jgi:hypothetical protein